MDDYVTLPAKDALGTLMETIDDIGGRSDKGELLHKDNIYDCLNCGKKVSIKDTKFVDNNKKKPLCHHSKKFFGKGCYSKHWKKHSIVETMKNPESVTNLDTLIETVEALKNTTYK